MKTFQRLALLLFLGGCALAQEDRPVRFFPNDPAGNCSVISPIWNNWALGRLWQCVGASGTNAGTWQRVTGTGGGAWGSITGTLASQTDVSAAIAAAGLGSATDVLITVATGTPNTATLNYSGAHVNTNRLTITAVTQITIPTLTASGDYRLVLTNTGPVSNGTGGSPGALSWAGMTQNSLPTAICADTTGEITNIAFTVSNGAVVAAAANCAGGGTPIAAGGLYEANPNGGAPITANQNAVNAPGYNACGGTANAQTVSLLPIPTLPTANTQTLTFSCLPNSTNTTTTPTMFVNGIGSPVTIVRPSGALVAGDYATTRVASYRYEYNSGTPQIVLENPITSPSAGSTLYAASGGYTGSVAMTGSDVVVYTASSVPALGAGACYVLQYSSSTLQAATWKLKVDGTTVVTLWTPGGSESDFMTGLYCNDSGSQTAQHFIWTAGWYQTTIPASGTVTYYISNYVPVAATTNITTWASGGHTVTLTANSSSGSVIGNAFRWGQ